MMSNAEQNEVHRLGTTHIKMKFRHKKTHLTLTGIRSAYFAVTPNRSTVAIFLIEQNAVSFI